MHAAECFGAFGCEAVQKHTHRHWSKWPNYSRQYASNRVPLSACLTSSALWISTACEWCFRTTTCPVALSVAIWRITSRTTVGSAGAPSEVSRSMNACYIRCSEVNFDAAKSISMQRSQFLHVDVRVHYFTIFFFCENTRVIKTTSYQKKNQVAKKVVVA